MRANAALTRSAYLMTSKISPFRTGHSEPEQFTAMARVAAAVAALECADDPYEFGRIHRAILTAMHQTFPGAFVFNDEEVEE
jgi:hypothetical protein